MRLPYISLIQLEVIPKLYESFLEPVPNHFRIDSSVYWVFMAFILNFSQLFRAHF
jgi:hypothetical protein